MKVVRLIYNHVPRWIRRTLYSLIFLPFAGHLYIQWMTGQSIRLEKDPIIGTIGFAAFLATIGYMIGAYKVIKDLQSRLKLSERKVDHPIITFSKNEKKIKGLPDKIILSKINEGIAEIDLKLKRCFLPDEKPEMEKFIQRVELGEPRCTLCKSTLVTKNSRAINRPGLKYYTCPNNICKNHNVLLYLHKLDMEQLYIQNVSQIRFEYDKYWSIYCNEYDRLTEGKYEDYMQPLNY